MVDKSRSIYPRSFFEVASVRSRSVFILMPFSEDFSEQVHSTLRGAISDAGLTPSRSDDVFEPRPVLEKIVRGIAESEAIIADATGRNPNVFYELGISHAEKYNVILIAQDADDIPFDLRPFDHIIYRCDGDGLAELGKRVRETLQRLPHEPEGRSKFPNKPVERQELILGIRDDLRQAIGSWMSLVAGQVEAVRGSFGDTIGQRGIEEAVAQLHSHFFDPWSPIEA